MCFPWYTTQHKDIKCLDIAEGRYISRDVVFDEIVFPFAKLHSNAGARLHAEIFLLSSHLFAPIVPGHDGVCLTDDASLNNSPTNLNS
jgi:hypothetical protein